MDLGSGVDHAVDLETSAWKQGNGAALFAEPQAAIKGDGDRRAGSNGGAERLATLPFFQKRPAAEDEDASRDIKNGDSQMGGEVVGQDSPWHDQGNVRNGNLQSGGCILDGQGQLAAGMPNLILKLGKEGVGHARRREIHKESPTPLAAGIMTRSALIHVNQAHTVAGFELEGLIIFCLPQVPSVHQRHTPSWQRSSLA